MSNADDKIERLIHDCDIHRSFATALVRSGGRCEYCGRDLLRDRLGYGVATVDHLLPTSTCSEEVAECEYNWVYCCGFCNSTKHDWSPDGHMAVASPDDLRDCRTELILRARAHIYNRLATTHDPAWFRVLDVMEGRPAE